MQAATVKAIEQIEREFHRRAFGEEFARVNLLSAAERRAYLARLGRRAASLRRAKGSDARSQPVRMQGR